MNAPDALPPRPESRIGDEPRPDAGSQPGLGGADREPSAGVDLDDQKRSAGEAAATLVEDGMRVGFGTGSTARHFTLAVARRLHSGDLGAIVSVPTSRSTAELLLESGIETADLDGPLDLAVDGADEVGPDRTLIKGGGGALVREKIVAAAAARFVVVVDAAKVVDRLGVGFALPVEVARFGIGVTTRALERFGRAEVRGGDRPFVTDNGNHIVDIHTGGIEDPVGLDGALNRLPGVFGTGLFVGMVDDLIVGGPEGIQHYRVEA